MNWFALSSNGYMYRLGVCADFDEADAKADADCLFAVWIFDETTATEFVEVLTNENHQRCNC